MKKKTIYSQMYFEKQNSNGPEMSKYDTA